MLRSIPRGNGLSLLSIETHYVELSMLTTTQIARFTLKTWHCKVETGALTVGALNLIGLDSVGCQHTVV